MEKQEKSLIEQFIILSHLMMYKHHRKGNHVHSPYQGQGRVLSLLKIEPKMSQKKLCFLLGIRPQSIGELLGKLEQTGNIIRTPSEEDRRSVDVKLTEKGMEAAIASEKLQESEQGIEDVFGCLSVEEQNNLSAYLSRVIAALQKDIPQEQSIMMHGHHHGHVAHFIQGFCGFHKQRP
ncbi:MAG: MarR family transcriptional regulator [Selenomonadaceae bacterium]